MLTVDFDRLVVREGDTLLDLGCGQGRHTFEALRRGAEVTAVDQSTSDLAEIETMVAAMAEAGEIKPQDGAVTLEADACALPFADGSFDRVIAAEVLEHIPDDASAISEIARVTKQGGLVAVTVPRRGPERVCWALSREYHEVEGGHVRIYRGAELVRRLQDAGLEPIGQHHAHALHAPYWWLKCAVGVNRENAATRAYHRLLVWDMMSRPALTTTTERVLNPVLGKSLVLYFGKPVVAP
jgi:SAM-dependent methyltransferase